MLNDVLIEIIADRVRSVGHHFEQMVGGKWEYFSQEKLTDTIWIKNDIGINIQRTWRPPYYESKNEQIAFPVTYRGWLCGLLVLTELHLSHEELLSLARLLNVAISQSSDNSEKLEVPQASVFNKIQGNHYFLISPSYDLALRLALEIHDISGRTVFLSRAELTHELISEQKSLNDLGETTLFIDDVARWPISEQEFFLKYLNENSQSQLRLIIGSQFPLIIAVNKGLLIPEIAEKLRGFIIQESKTMNFRDWINVHMRRLSVESDPLRFH